MTLILKQSASIDIRMGPFVDATDAVTPETGITLAGADQAEVLKADGALTATMAGAFTGVTGCDGWYDYTCATGDVDTVGEVVFVVQDSSVCLPVFVRGYVVEEAVYDAMYGGSAVGPALASVVGTLTDAAAAGDPTTADTVMQYIKQLVNVLVGTTGVTTFPAEAAPANNVSLAEVIRAIHADVTGLNGDAMITTAQVNTEVDTALADIGLDHLISSALPTSWAVDVAANSVFDQVADDGTAAYDRTTDSLQATRDAVTTVDTVVDGIQTDLDNGTDGLGAIKAETALIVADTNELQTDWVNGGRLDLILDARASQTTADAIETDTQDIQGRLPAALVSGRMDADVGAISTSTAAADNLEASALGIVTGACEGTPSTTVVQTDLAEATDDHYIGRVVVFTSGVAAGQASDITDYTGSTGTITITAITTAPSASDTFVIV